MKNFEEMAESLELVAAGIRELGRRVDAIGSPPDKLLEACDGYRALSIRARNALRRGNIRTLGELRAIPEDELLAIRNFGESSLTVIRSFLLRQEESEGVAEEGRKDGRKGTTDEHG